MGSAQRLAGVLAVVAGLAALGALFGPSGRWGGMDVGATAAAVCVLAIGALIWLFSVRGDQVFPEYMSLTERRAWVGLGFIGVILADYARQIFLLSQEAVVPEQFHGLFAHQFFNRLILLIIAWSVISQLIGRGVGGVAADERDLRMRHGADRVGDWALTLIVIAGIVVLASIPAARLAWWLSPIVLANLLIGLLIVKTLAEHVALTLAYRSRHA